MIKKPEGAIAKRPKIYFDVDPRLRNRFKAAAALRGITLREWATEALIEKLEDEEDVREGLAALNEPGESIPWEQVKAEWEALHRKRGIPGSIPPAGQAAASPAAR